MKKVLYGFMLLFFVSSVFAQSESVTPSGDVGSVDADSVFYGIDVALDEVGVVFATNDNAKALKRLEIAKERLAEAEYAKTSFGAERASLEEEKQIKNIEALNVDDSIVKDNYEKHILVLKRVMEKLMEKGNDNAVNAINYTINRASKK